MTDSNRPHARLFYGWYIVGTCVLISIYCAGVVTRSFTVLIEPIVAEFQWSYALVSFAVSITGLESGLLAPIVGFLFDRWGPRKLIFAGAIIMGLGLLLLSRANSLVMFYASFILMSTAVSVSIGVVPMTLVGNWFHRKVSLATGIVASGSAAGGIMVPLVTWVVDTYNWRTAMVVFGLGAWAIIFPLVLLVRHRPEQYGYLPDGQVSQTIAVDEVNTAVKYDNEDFSVKQALKNRAFWQISLAMVCHFLVSVAVLTHVMPYLSSIGISRRTSGWVAMAIQLLSIAGRLSFGWFGDRFDKRRLTATGMALMAIGMLLFNYIDVAGIWLMIMFLIFYGIGFGGPVPMSAALIREYFGRANLGTVLGLATGVAYVGSLIGAPLAGWIYDTYGSYQVAWFIMAGLAFVGMVGFMTVPSVRRTRVKAAGS
jgi:sugar phosphate permease